VGTDPLKFPSEVYAHSGFAKLGSRAVLVKAGLLFVGIHGCALRLAFRGATRVDPMDGIGAQHFNGIFGKTEGWLIEIFCIV